MKGFNDWSYDVEVESLGENIFKRFVNNVKQVASRVIKRSVSAFKKVRPGGKVVIRFPIPRSITESAQTGKSGGELAELALLDELHSLLAKHISKKDGVPRSSISERVYFNHGVDKNTWYNSAYKTGESNYDKSAKTASDRKEKSMWIQHGKTSGQLIYRQLVAELGEDISLTNFQLLHEGQSEIGKTKKDFSIILHKHNSLDAKRSLGFSMKATVNGSPYETPTQAYQSGYAATVLSLITGKYTKEMENLGGDIAGYSAAINRLKDIKDPDKRTEQLAKIKSSYEKTYLYTLDKMGTKMGYGTSTLKGNQIADIHKNSALLLGQYLDALQRYFKDSKKQRRAEKDAGLRAQRSGRGEEFTVQVNDYIEIVYDILNQEIKKNPIAVIRKLLKFGGIEKDLYYIAAGLSPKSSTASAAVSTLFDGEWEKMRDALLKSKSLSIEIQKKTTNAGANNIFVEIKSNGLGLTKDWKAGTTLVRFTIWKDDKDTRITLPKFNDEDMVKVDQRTSADGKRKVGGKTVDANSLLRKYGSGKINI